MFHWQDGWFFGRRGDGAVEITKRADSYEHAPIVAQALIPADHWASILDAIGDPSHEGAPARKGGISAHADRSLGREAEKK